MPGKLPNEVFVHPQALAETETFGPGTKIWAFTHPMLMSGRGSYRFRGQQQR